MFPLNHCSTDLQQLCNWPKKRVHPQYTLPANSTFPNSRVPNSPVQNFSLPNVPLPNIDSLKFEDGFMRVKGEDVIIKKLHIRYTVVNNQLLTCYKQSHNELEAIIT